MTDKKDLTPLSRRARDPLALLRAMTTDLDRFFDEPFWQSFRWPSFRADASDVAWFPKVDVFERNAHLITRMDLPGLKKEDITVEVSDGHLILSGERRHDTETKTGNCYRGEREYGHFSRTVPLPDGVKLEDVKATFTDGVLEVSVPLPARPEAQVRRVEIQAPSSDVKSAA